MFIKEIEFVLKNFPIKKTSSSYSFTSEFFQKLKEEIIQIVKQLLQEIFEIPESLLHTKTNDNPMKENY